MKDLNLIHKYERILFGGSALSYKQRLGLASIWASESFTLLILGNQLKHLIVGANYVTASLLIFGMITHIVVYCVTMFIVSKYFSLYNKEYLITVWKKLTKGNDEKSDL